jgi:hypothetical protein
MGAINTMKPFLSYFGLQEAAASTGIWFGVYTVGKRRSGCYRFVGLTRC